jgi:ADP-ribosylglycohydrolase
LIEQIGATRLFSKKVYGCLAGVAVGDALGMPAAGFTPAEIREKFGYIDGLLDAPPGHPFHDGLRKGHVTDDTELTMLLVEMILEDGAVTPDGMARRILNWATEKRLLETGLLGPSTSRAIRALMEGGDPSETGRYGTTNGAAMKISPIGIINAYKVENIVDDVEKVCLPTHGTSVAISAASAVAAAVAEALRPASTVTSVVEAAKTYSKMGNERGRQVTHPSVTRRIELALDLIEGEASPWKAAEVLYDYIGADVSITNSVPTSFGLFVASEGDPMVTIESAVNMGGDTDTIGAIAGGIAGAFKGIDAFPEDMVRQVEEESSLDLALTARKLVEFARK